MGRPSSRVEIEVMMEVLQSLGRGPKTLTDLPPVLHVVDIDQHGRGKNDLRILEGSEDSNAVMSVDDPVPHVVPTYQ